MDKNSDLYVFTATLWMEARGEGEAGIAAVASVIMNRYHSHRWYSHISHFYTITNTCKKPYQFSCWNPGDQCDTRLPQADHTSEQWKTCEKIARQAMSGHLSDNTQGATHYYADYIPAPAWVKSLVFTCQINNHLFFKEPDTDNATKTNPKQ